MNKKLTITLILIVLLPLFVSADPEQYLTSGVSRDNTYQQDGTGVWTGRTPTTYVRTPGIGIQSYFPLVGDVDGDNANEIVIIADDQLQILNYTTGVGVILEQGVTHGNTTLNTDTYYITPYLLDTDSDGTYEIISNNITHFMMYSWNGTQIVINQSASTSLNLTADFNQMNVYPSIKCAQGNQWESGNDTCVMIITNRSGATAFPIIEVYDLDSGVLRESSVAVGIANDDTTFKSTHLADGDNDGFLEVYQAYNDVPNGDLRVYEIEVSSTAITWTLLITHALAPNRPFTDIIVNNMDGTLSNGMEITWGYSSDGTNFDAYTIRADGGAVVDASYCTVLTCPEGDMLGANMFLPSTTTYTEFTGDVCYYLRNWEENDPGANIDTIHCFSIFAGSDRTETEVINVAHNFTRRPIVHEAQLHGSIGLLTQRFTTEGDVLQGTPAFTETDVIIPVDYQQSGTLDMIGMNASRLVYYDDAYTNQNVVIVSSSPDTGNPVCFGELLTIKLTLLDAESDLGRCHIQETWSNGTQKSIQSNTSFALTPISLNYYADETGTFPLNLRCRDQFHTEYASRTYTVTVINDTTACNFKGQGAVVIDYVIDEDLALNDDFLTGFNIALADVGVRGTLFKGMIWVLMIMVVIGGFALAAARQGMSGNAIGMIVMVFLAGLLVIGWYLDMISGVPLVMFSLVLATVIGFKVWSNSANVAGGGGA